MEEKDPVVRFLARPENLAIALEIERQLPEWDRMKGDVGDERLNPISSSPQDLAVASAIVQRLKPIKNNLLETFWPSIHSNMSARLINSAFSEKWQTTISKDKKWTRPYASCFISLKNIDSVPEAPDLKIEIQQSASYNLNYGVGRNEPKKKRPTFWILPEVKRLETHLQHNNYISGGIWWLGYRSDYNVLEDKFLLGMAGRYETFIDDVTEPVWELFLEVRPMLVEANTAIQQLALSEAE